MPSPAAPPAAVLHAAPGRYRTRRGFCVRRHAACAWRRGGSGGLPLRRWLARSQAFQRKPRKQVITGG